MHSYHKRMPTMQALVKREAKPGLWLEEVPVPGMGINDVKIRVDRASICGRSALRAPSGSAP